MNTTCKPLITWSNIDEIVETLRKEYAHVREVEGIMSLRFSQLKIMVQALPNFSNDDSCNERKLEAIQQGLLEMCEEDC